MQYVNTELFLENAHTIAAENENTSCLEKSNFPICCVVITVEGALQIVILLSEVDGNCWDLMVIRKKPKEFFFF